MGQNAVKEKDSNQVRLTEHCVIKVDKSTRYLSIQDETIVHVSCGSYHSAVVCESGRVFTFGRNKHFQLGLKRDATWPDRLSAFITSFVRNVSGLPGFHSDENNSCEVNEPTLVASLSAIPIVQVACGHDFTHFLSATGELFACGLNDEKQLGIGGLANTLSGEPIRIMGIPPIKKVAAGWGKAFALTYTGDVWMSGRCSMFDDTIRKSFEQLTHACGPITDVSCGDHTVMLTATGVVYTTEINYSSSFGLIKDLSDKASSFHRVDLPTAVIAIDCGFAYTVALTIDGTAWAWGCNYSGQLGVGYIGKDTKTYTTHKILGLENRSIVSVSAGGNRTAVITKEGEVMLCGARLGGDVTSKVYFPVQVTQSSPELRVQEVALSRDYVLIFAVSKTKEVLAAHDQPQTEVSDMEKSIIKSLECPICYEIMYAPICQCINGHSVCHKCRSNTPHCSLCKASYIETRNIGLESLGAHVMLPRVNCFKRMPANLLENHAEVCPKRTYSCPVDKVCRWRGQQEDILNHITSAHPEQTWQDLTNLFVRST